MPSTCARVLGSGILSIALSRYSSGHCLKSAAREADSARGLRAGGATPPISRGSVTPGRVDNRSDTRPPPPWRSTVQRSGPFVAGETLRIVGAELHDDVVRLTATTEVFHRAG